MKMYQVVELERRSKKTYFIGFETEKEMSNYINSKRIFNENIVAWELKEDGYGYVDLEKTWKIYGRK